MAVGCLNSKPFIDDQCFVGIALVKVGEHGRGCNGKMIDGDAQCRDAVGHVVGGVVLLLNQRNRFLVCCGQLAQGKVFQCALTRCGTGVNISVVVVELVVQRVPGAFKMSGQCIVCTLAGGM